MRTKSSIRNLTAAFLGQLLGIAISFISRKIFIGVLDKEYLGINGLFTNILSMLSIMELGVGPAIVFCLYKPLAEDNRAQILALMKLFRRLYCLIGCGILAAGIGISFFLPVFLKEAPDIPQLQLIFILFVANSAVSYFFSYKRSLIIADQRRYIATIYRYTAYFLLNAAQCAILIWTGNYIQYLLIQFLATFLENLLVSKKAEQLYPYLKEKAAEKLDAKTIKSITQNVGAMFFHKLGGIFVNSTDNIILSKFIGIGAVGLYSNYELVLNALSKVIYQIFEAFTASIGNMGATENPEKSRKIFYVLQFLDAWIFGVSSICLWILFNPFIEVFFGRNMLLGQGTVGVIVGKYYLTGMRKAVLTYRDAYGLYWQDRYKPLFEIAINIGASIALVEWWGISGVFLGTIISTVTTCFWVEPYILFKYVFQTKSAEYFWRTAAYTGVSLAVGAAVTWISGSVRPEGIADFVILCALSFGMSNLLFLAIYFRRWEFQYIIRTGWSYFAGRRFIWTRK